MLHRVKGGNIGLAIYARIVSVTFCIVTIIHILPLKMILLLNHNILMTQCGRTGRTREIKRDSLLQTRTTAATLRAKSGVHAGERASLSERRFIAGLPVTVNVADPAPTGSAGSPIIRH